jgi:hypothetical protein
MPEVDAIVFRFATLAYDAEAIASIVLGEDDTFVMAPQAQVDEYWNKALLSFDQLQQTINFVNRQMAAEQGPPDTHGAGASSSSGHGTLAIQDALPGGCVGGEASGPVARADSLAIQALGGFTHGKRDDEASCISFSVISAPPVAAAAKPPPPPLPSSPQLKAVPAKFPPGKYLPGTPLQTMRTIVELRSPPIVAKPVPTIVTLVEPVAKPMPRSARQSVELTP